MLYGIKPAELDREYTLRNHSRAEAAILRGEYRVQMRVPMPLAAPRLSRKVHLLIPANLQGAWHSSTSTILRYTQFLNVDKAYSSWSTQQISRR